MNASQIIMIAYVAIGIGTAMVAVATRWRRDPLWYKFSMGVATAVVWWVYWVAVVGEKTIARRKQA